MSLSQTIRSRLEMQGFCELDEGFLEEVEPWIRFAPALCTSGMALGTVLAAPTVLWALAVISALGALFSHHPFDLLYNYGIRHMTGTRPLPPNGTPRRFACGLASAWLVATGLAFRNGATITGYVLGTLITVTALIVTVTHFCIPSLMYRTLFVRQPRTA